MPALDELRSLAAEDPAEAGGDQVPVLAGFPARRIVGLYPDHNP